MHYVAFGIGCARKCSGLAITVGPRPAEVAAGPGHGDLVPAGFR